MFGLLSRSRKPVSSPWRNRARLGVERLEMRDCPAAPVITSFSVVPLANKMVNLSGTLTDTNPATTWVNFGGQVQGSVQADATGHFSAQTAATGVGTATATATDQAGLTSPSVSAPISVPAPQITLTLTYGTGHQLILSGKVTDNWPNGLTVKISGLVSGTTTTDANGNYSTTLTANTPNGTIYASTTDSWSLNSNTASVSASNTAPVISNLSASGGGLGYWTITGKVTDEHPEGLVVTFSSTDVPAVNGQKATVQADGTFTLTVIIPSTQSGYIYAQTTDWWGIQSNLDWTIITQIIGGGNPTGG